MPTRIGGVEVARGGSVRWGLLFSIVAGSGLYAYFEGVVGLVVGTREFLFQDFFGGVRSFVVGLIDLEVAVAGAAVETAWWEFFGSVRSAGLLTWILTVLVFAAVLLVMMVLARKGVRAIA